MEEGFAANRERFAADSHLFAIANHLFAPESHLFAADNHLFAPKSHLFATDNHLFAAKSEVFRALDPALGALLALAVPFGWFFTLFTNSTHPPCWVSPSWGRGVGGFAGLSPPPGAFQREL